MTKNKWFSKIHHRLILAAFVFGFAVLFGASAHAQAISFTANTTVTVNSANFTINSGSAAATMTVGTATLTVTVPSGSDFVLVSPGRLLLNNDQTIAQVCSSTENRLTVRGPVTSLVISPSNSLTCLVSGGSPTVAEAAAASQPTTPAPTPAPVTPTPPAQPTPTPTVPSAVTLIRQIGDPKVYVIENGKRRHIKTAEEFIAAGYDWNAVREAAAAEVAAYPEQVILIRAAGDFKVYVVENGKRRHIKTVEEFATAGYEWNAVSEISSEQLSAYPDIVAKVRVLALRLNVRSLPSLGGKIMTRVAKDGVYQIVSEQVNWIKIKLPDGREGWVFKSYTVKE